MLGHHWPNFGPVLLAFGCIGNYVFGNKVSWHVRPHSLIMPILPTACVRASPKRTCSAAMSALGQKRTHALGQKRTLAGSFDRRVGAGEHCLWQTKTEDLGSRQIDDKLEFSWLLDWNIPRLCSTQNLIDIFGCIPKQL